MSDVSVTINDKELSVPVGSTILEAATTAGFDIPTLCHADNLKPFTSCFLCAVKVEGGRGLVPSCATKVRDGMKVIVEDEEIEASRRMCLNLLLSDHCGDCLPPCQAECPASIDIKGFLALAAEGKETEAAHLIREKAPFPGILGRVCPRPCESQCRRVRVEEPLSVCFMKRHIADTELKEMGVPQLPAPIAESGKHVGIIGAGPAGMSAALFLRLQGHKVTVIEKHKESGGMLRYGIPFYRLPDATLQAELGAVENLGVEVRYGVEVGKDITPVQLQKEFDALIIAAGAQGTASMRVEGENSPGVLPGIAFLERCAKGEKVDVGKKAFTVGGGNTAIDCARTALRLGAESTILYRRTQAEMPANDFEIEEALHEGVKMTFLKAPVKISSASGKVSVECVEMALGEPDESGRRRPAPVPGSEHTLEGDTLIAAIGQTVEASWVKELGVSLSRWGTVEVNPYTFMSDRKGIFSCGDCQTGADMAVTAVGNGRRAAYSVNQYLNEEAVTGEPVLFNSSMGEPEDVGEELFAGVKEKNRSSMPLIADADRTTSFQEVEKGFSPEAALAEAERCLKCGCDALKDCKLREYATRYRADQNLYCGQRRGFHPDVTHEKVKMEEHKCINCGACVRACIEVKKLNVLTYQGRGFATRMTVPFGRSLAGTACDGCGECVTVCPTAGVTLKEANAV